MQYKQLTLEQRYQISALLKAGVTKAQIACEIGVSRSTISREIKRNKGRHSYSPEYANSKSKKRRKYAKKNKRFTLPLQKIVRKKIEMDWSPEQVAGFLKRRHLASISHQTIYDFIRDDCLSGGTLYKHLRHSKKKRRKRYGTTETRGQIKNRVSIDERPDIVDKKERIGDWEIDTIIGRNQKGALVTMVERKTKFVVIGRVSRKKADMVKDVTVDIMLPHKKKVLSITGDNGKEFAGHEQISAELGCQFFFAHPYSSWERGLNENTNGLIRQYFPKGTDLRFVTKDDVFAVADKLNSRPRKTLGFRTPYETFMEILIRSD